MPLWSNNGGGDGGGGDGKRSLSLSTSELAALSPKKTRGGGKHISSSAPSLLARGDQCFNIKNWKEKETNKKRKKEEK